MRFFFTKGGRSGCWDLEALADYMDTWITSRVQPNTFGQKEITIADWGDMWVDFSPTKSGPGQLFKTRRRIVADFLNGEEMRALAARYWAEGEAIIIGQCAPEPEAQPPSDQGSKRL